MTKYVFVNVPGYGHVNPTLPVVRELVRRGEEVVYYLTEDFRSAVEATGARLLPYQPFGERPPSSLPPQRPAEGPVEMLEKIREEKPDCIVYDAQHLLARLIAEILKVPTVLSCPTLAANEHFNPLKEHYNLLGEQLEAPMEIPTGTLEKIQGMIMAMRRKYGLGDFDIRDFHSHTEELNIVYMPREFQPSSELFDERYVFVGPSLLQQAADDVTREKGEGKKTLYISLGTAYNDQPEFFKQCFTAFGKEPWKVVLARGKQIGEQEREGIPENFRVEAYVEQWKVLPQTDVFITHGGINSVMESLYYGVPMVVIPQQDEQVMNGRRVVELGLGVMLDQNKLTIDDLYKAVEQVYINQALYERVREMQRTVRACGGYQLAADAIMKFARKHALSARL
jgi:MGT family glycosyltransferase